MQQGQNLQQRQNLHLSAYMHQSTQILSLSIADLFEEISDFLDTNPALGVDESFFKKFEKFSPRGTGDQGYIEKISDQIPSLQEVLRAGCQLENFSPEQQEIAAHIISSLDEQGFLPLSNQKILEKEFDTQEYQFILKKIQLIEPVGCATANSYESLCVQMYAQNFQIQPSPITLKKVFQAWAKGKKDLCQKLLQLDAIDKVDAFIDLVKTLSPFPATGYQTKTISKITPEYKVFYTKEGVLTIKPLYELRKMMHICPNFQKNISSLTTQPSPEIIKPLQDAQNFLQILEYREHTILRAVRSIVIYQKKFFEQGWIALQPLTQKQVADSLQLHEATISRAIHARYLETPQGVIKIQDLFSPKLSHKNGPVSKKALQILISQIIDESPAHISDQKIAEKLHALGYQIARRTVTKYRNELETL